MSATTIDTLRIYERLKNADLNENAASEIAEVLKETIEDRIATKNDLENLRDDLKIVLAETKVEIIKWVAGMLLAQAVLIASLVKLL